MGFASGLLNMELDAPDVAQYEAIAKERGLEIEYRILDYGAEHPGNYRAEVWDQNGNVVHWEAIAVGGGMVEMQKYEEFSVQIAGDFYELLVIAEVAPGIREKIEALLPDVEFFQSDQKEGQILYNWKLAVPLTKEVIQAVRGVAGVGQACYLEPVLPTHSSVRVRFHFRRQLPWLIMRKSIRWIPGSMRWNMRPVGAVSRRKRFTIRWNRFCRSWNRRLRRD